MRSLSKSQAAVLLLCIGSALATPSPQPTDPPGVVPPDQRNGWWDINNPGVRIDMDQQEWKDTVAGYLHSLPGPMGEYNIEYYSKAPMPRHSAPADPIAAVKYAFGELDEGNGLPHLNWDRMEDAHYGLHKDDFDREIPNDDGPIPEGWWNIENPKERIEMDYSEWHELVKAYLDSFEIPLPEEIKEQYDLLPMPKFAPADHMKAVKYAIEIYNEERGLGQLDLDAFENAGGKNL